MFTFFYLHFITWRSSCVFYTTVLWSRLSARASGFLEKSCLVGEGSVEGFSWVFFKPVFWSIKPKLGNGKALMSPPATGTTEIFTGCIPIFLLKSFLRSWESPLSGLTWGFDCWKIFVHFLFLPLDRIWWGLLNASLPNRSAFLFGTPVGGRSWAHLGQRPLGFSWNKEVK